MLLNTKDSSTLFGAIAQRGINKKEASQYGDLYTEFKRASNYSDNPDVLSQKWKYYDFKATENLTENVKNNLIEIQKEVNKGTITAEEGLSKVNNLMVDTSNKSTVLGNSIKNFFKGLLNGLVSMGASALLSWGISEGIKAIDKLINKSKYIQQAAKKARESIASIQSELKTTTDTVDNTKQRYAELAQEVNHLGTVAQSQGTLSNDEYKEFLDLSNQLAEVFPTLTQGYDDNGNAILKLSGDVDTIVGSLERLVEVEREAANAEIGKKMPKVWAGFVDEIKNESDNLEIATKILEAVKDQDFSLGTGKLTNYNSDTKALSQAANISGVKINLDKAMDEYDTTGIIDLSYLEMADREKLAAAFKVIENNWDRSIRGHEAVIESKTKEMYDYLMTQFVDDSYYKNLTEEQKKIFNGLLLNRDYKKIVEDFGDNYEAAFNEIQTQINTIMDKMPEGSDNQKKFQDYYEKIFSIDTSEGVFAENIEQIKQYIQELADLLGIEYIDLAEIFGLSDIDADLKSVKDRFIVNNSSGSSKSTYDVNKILKELSKGGNVDLTNRPKVNTAYLNNAGWKDVGQGYATVYSSTFGNEEGTEYINFTPIIVDPETGEFKGVLTPEELTEYAEGVIAGTREDDLNLQIGASFDTVEAAEKAAEEIHRYHELINGGDYSSETNLGYISFDPRKQKAEQEAKKEYEAFIDSLSKEDFDFWKNALDNGQIPQEVLHSGEQGLKDYLEELQKIADQNEIKVKASDAVDSMADMKSAVASLSDLYNQTVLQAASENADSFGTFAADPATLNSIESAFDKFIQKESEAGNDVTELNAALNEFQRTAVEEYGSSDYAEKMQVAIDNLITSYIDQTDVIKNLTEENAEWSKEQLKAMGIENADAVVKAKLSKKTKELMGNVTKLANSYNELTEAEEGTDAYNEVLDSMAGDVAEMAGLDRNNQDYIDTDFVVKNLDLIRDAAAGSADAINQLRKEAAKEIAAKVHIEGNTQEILGYRDEINNLINNFNIDDIEVGARLDDNAMIKGLNNLVDAGIITRDSMNNILSGIGVEPYRTPGIDIPIEVYDQLKGLSGQALTEASRTLAMKSSIKVPGISYRVTSKATGAKYSAPSGGGSSSGGGGGGGGSSEPTKPKEESEETFD